jgi:hypothetical protein
LLEKVVCKRVKNIPRWPLPNGSAAKPDGEPVDYRKLALALNPPGLLSDFLKFEKAENWLLRPPFPNRLLPSWQRIFGSIGDAQ